MRRLIQTATAAAAAVGLALGPVTVAQAAPISPNEWWFGAWNMTTDVWPQTKGAGVTVAVVDTGVNASLPDMRPAVLPGIDLFHDHMSGNGQQDHDTNEGHGTAMASLIAARGTHSGFYGIAPESKILPIYSPGNSPTDVSKAIHFAADHGAKVMNFSRGESSSVFKQQCPDEVLQALKFAEQKDIVIVASAGNEGDYSNDSIYPASCPGVLAVGAIDRQLKPWEHTQRQNYVTVGAPGADVGAIGKTGHVYNSGAGTSQASALTSGAVALIRAKYPQMKARRVVQLLTNTAKDFGKPGKDDQLGYGVISIPRALKNNVPQTAQNPVYARLDKAVVKKPAGGNQTAPKTKSDSDDSGSSNMPLVIGGLVVVVVLIAVGVFIALRRRSGSGGKPGGPYASGPFPNGPQQMGQPGTPPSFGGRTGGQPLPPQGGGQQFQAPPLGHPNPNMAPPPNGPPQGQPNPYLAPPQE
ncbi:S8 family serine peptidase [Actinomadura violacea]|uniref:S8 family serine peptidase n=1 Tax=Actinomadura violacea TaxID=2819934 RepID=A0ABS3RTZ0_9ACTN|nr:S8 family serine peptidase [Actinomadura violacea]MBO2460237.1 S8 family serine peptidase [Actinomadura violacea]